MNPAEQIDKYKNIIINIVIIIVTLIIATNIYKGNQGRLESLNLKINEEEKKNSELEKISQMESREKLYKKLLAKREASLIMADINDITKAAGVNVLSVKPLQKESSANYSKDIFAVTVNTSSYHNLGQFIDALESYGNVYIVESMEISNQASDNKKGLAANLRISSVVMANK